MGPGRGHRHATRADRAEAGRARPGLAHSGAPDTPDARGGFPAPRRLESPPPPRVPGPPAHVADPGSMTSPPPAPTGPRAPRPRPTTPVAPWIAPGCLIVGALVLLRLAIAVELAVQGRGADPEVAAFGVAARFLPEFVNALVLGCVAAAVAVHAAGLGRGGLGARLGTFALVVVLLSLGLLGWPGADPRDVPAPWSGGATSARLAHPATLASLALGGAVLLVLLGWAGARSLAVARLLGSRAALVACALVGLVLPFARVQLEARSVPAMPLRSVVRELLVEPGALVLGGDPAAVAAARVATLSPAIDSRYDVADKPALILPPGAQAEFRVRPEDGAVRLRAAAGVDFTVRAQGGGQFTLRFRVELNGADVFDERRDVRVGMANEHRVWRHVGGAEGLTLVPGDRVRLSTSIEEQGREFAPDPIVCGFGGLVLERLEAAPRSVATRERPNIVLVVMDTLRADRLSCYGYAKPTTPHADRLAARGMLFEEAFATSSWTWPATASILTGLEPEQHGVTSNQSCTLALSNESLPELLQTRGLTTGGFSGNPLIAPERFFDQGFESFRAWPRMEMSDGLIDDILGWIDRHADVRFFLYLQLVDPHTPHRPLESELARLGGEMPADFPRPVHEGQEVDGMDYYTSILLRAENLDAEGKPRPELVPEAHRQWIHDVYDASVGTGDHYFGLVLERLERLGLDRNTLVVFTSDHGEELFDHGCLAHGHTLHRELVRIPLIVAGPGVPAGVRVKQPVSNRHLAPTLARVAAGELRQIPDPVNLLGDLSEVSARATFSTEKGHWNGNRNEPLHGLREGRYTLHWNPYGRPFGTAREQAPRGGEKRLYDSWTDPGETVDVGPGEAELAAELRRGLEVDLRAQRERRLAPAVGIGASARRMLIDTGYIGSEEEDGEDPPR